jgi:hypothetical protein
MLFEVLLKFPEYVKEDLLKFPIHISLENAPKAPLGVCRFNYSITIVL